MRQTRSSARAKNPPMPSNPDAVSDSEESDARTTTTRTRTRTRAEAAVKAPKRRARASASSPVLPPSEPRATSSASRAARRSAKRPAVAKSIASIRTSVLGDSESDDVGEDANQEDDDLPMEDLHAPPSARTSSPPSPEDTINANLVARPKTQESLLNAARDLYGHLCLADRDDTWEDLFVTYSSVFSAWKGLYARGGSLFLYRDYILGILDPSSPEASTISNVVSAANLLVLLELIYLVKDTPEQAVHIFRQIDEGFPLCIMAPESARAETYETCDTFARALDIRISLWILDIAQTFDDQAAVETGAMLLLGVQPGELLHPDDFDAATFTFRSIYGVDFDDPNDKSSEMRDMREKIFNAYNAVCGYIIGNDRDGLQREFPVAGVLDKLSDWAQAMFEEVMHTIEHVPARRGSTGEPESVEEDMVETLYSGKESFRALNRARFAPSATSDQEERPRDDDGDDTFMGEDGDAEEEEDQEEEEEEAAPSPVRSHPPKTVQVNQEYRERSPVLRPRAGSRPASTARSVTTTAPQVRHPTSREPRTRVFWDAEDLEVIEDLVAKHGSFWAEMEKVARAERLFSVERTQQHIRDKARNMKVDKLKDDQILPLNFDKVVLSQRDRSRLISLGKNPERKEADVEDGHPVNTEWLGSDA